MIFPVLLEMKYTTNYRLLSYQIQCESKGKIIFERLNYAASQRLKKSIKR